MLTLQSFSTDTDQVSAGARLDRTPTATHHIYSQINHGREQMLQVCATNEQRGECFNEESAASRSSVTGRNMLETDP